MSFGGGKAPLTRTGFVAMYGLAGLKTKFGGLVKQRLVESQRPQVDYFVDELIAIASAFPGPEGDRDIGSHSESLTRVMQLLALKSVYGLSKDHEERLERGLRVAESSLASTLTRHRIEEGAILPGRFLSYVEGQQAAVPELARGWEWKNVIDDPPFGGVLTLIRLNKSKTVESSDFFENALYYYRQFVPSLRHRVLIAKYWDRFNTAEKSSAVHKSCSPMPSYQTSLTNLMFSDSRRNASETTGADLKRDARLYDDLEGKIDRLLTSPKLTNDQRDMAVATDFSCRYRRVQYEWLMRQDKTKIDDLATAALNAFEQAANLPVTASHLSYYIRYFAKEESAQRYDLTETELAEMFSPFLEAENAELRGTAKSFFGRVELVSGAQVGIQAPTSDGEPFDTRDLEGKIVLIDHWDTQCAPCIAAMPSLHETYLKYKNRGFEVVSIAYDGESRRRAVDRYKKEMGLTWTTLNGEGLWGGISVKYGLSGFPSYMLLDREGRFVAGNDQLRDVSNLPRILDEMLAEESKGQEAAVAR